MTFDNYLIEKLRDPKEATAFLLAAIEAYREDRDHAAYIHALWCVIRARSGLTLTELI